MSFNGTRPGTNTTYEGRRGRRLLGAAVGAAAVVALVILSATFGRSPAPVATPTQRPTGEACAPALQKLDPANVELTGLWSGDDRGIYYIRQIGEHISWSGMSDRSQAQGEMGRDWNNVAMGNLADDLSIDVQWADVPHGNILGGGTMHLQVEPDTSGIIQIHKLSETGSGFGANIWTRCATVPHTFATFDQPFAYTPPEGLALSNFEGSPHVVAIAAPSEREAEMDVWSIGPDWLPTCSAPATTTKFEATAAAFLDYLRSVPELSVGAATPMTIGASSATMVDVTTAAGAKGCPGDQRVHLWNEGADQATLGLRDTQRLIVMDQGGSTLVFEVYAKDLPAWWTDAQAILDTVTFAAGAEASPAP